MGRLRNSVRQWVIMVVNAPVLYVFSASLYAVMRTATSVAGLYCNDYAV